MDRMTDDQILSFKVIQNKNSLKILWISFSNTTNLTLHYGRGLLTFLSAEPPCPKLLPHRTLSKYCNHLIAHLQV